MSNVVTYRYDPKDCLLLVGGYPFEMYGEGSFITVSRAEDANSPQVGEWGDVTVNKNRKMHGTITVTVKAQSIEDGLLDQLQDAGPVPIILQIKSANKILVTDGWYQTQADLAAGAQIDDRAHVIGVANASFSLIDSANSVLGQIEQIKF